jgi:hypothetical protein
MHSGEVHVVAGQEDPVEVSVIAADLDDVESVRRVPTTEVGAGRHQDDVTGADRVDGRGGHIG